MKKRLSYVFIFLFMLVFPMLSRAASVSVSLSCPTSASQGAIVDCKVNVTSDVKVNGVSGKFTFSGLSYSDFSAQSGFTVYNSSASGFSVGNTSGKSGTFTVGV